MTTPGTQGDSIGHEPQASIGEASSRISPFILSSSNTPVLVQHPQPKRPRDAPSLDDGTELRQYEYQLKNWTIREMASGTITVQTWFPYVVEKISQGNRLKRLMKEPEDAFQGPQGFQAYMALLYKMQGITSETVGANQVSIMTEKRSAGTPLETFATTFDDAKVIHEKYNNPSWTSRTYAELFLSGLNLKSTAIILHHELQTLWMTAPASEDVYRILLDVVCDPARAYAEVHKTETKTRAYYQTPEDTAMDGEVGPPAYFGRSNPSGRRPWKPTTARVGAGSGPRTTASGVNRPDGSNSKWNSQGGGGVGRQWGEKKSIEGCHACGLAGHYRRDCKVPPEWRKLFQVLYDCLGSPTLVRRFPDDRTAAAAAFYANSEQYAPGMKLPENKLDATFFSCYPYFAQHLHLPSRSQFPESQTSRMKLNVSQANQPCSPLTIVADTGSPKSVCGVDWLVEYCKRANCGFPKLNPPVGNVRFGANSHAEDNLGWTTLDLNFEDSATHTIHTITVDVDVIRADIPLLLSKRDLQWYDTWMDTHEGEFIFNSHQSAASFAVTVVDPHGHHFHLPLVFPSVTTAKNYTVAHFMARADPFSNESLRKIHDQFGHRPLEEMLNLIQKGYPDAPPDVVVRYRQVHGECTYCIKYRRPPPVPVVSVPSATTPGEVLHIDVMFVNGEAILLVVDAFSNLRITQYVGDKLNAAQVLQILKDVLFAPLGTGVPKRIVWDQESSLISLEVQRFLQAAGVIELVAAPRDAHFYNGLAETSITPLRRQIQIVCAEQGLSVREALPLATLRINSMALPSGFTPLTLWHGRTVELPGDSESLSARTPSPSELATNPVWAHLGALQTARDANFSFKARARIQRALRHNLRNPTNLESIARGTLVYAYRDGPGGKLGVYEGPFPYLGDDGSRRALLLSGNRPMLCHASRILPTATVENVILPASAVPADSLTLLEPVQVDESELDRLQPMSDKPTIMPPPSTALSADDPPTTTSRIILAPTTAIRAANSLMELANTTPPPSEPIRTTPAVLVEPTQEKVASADIVAEPLQHPVDTLSTSVEFPPPAATPSVVPVAPAELTLHHNDQEIHPPIGELPSPTHSTVIEPSTSQTEPINDLSPSTIQESPPTRQLRSGRIVPIVDYAVLSGKRRAPTSIEPAVKVPRHFAQQLNQTLPPSSRTIPVPYSEALEDPNFHPAMLDELESFQVTNSVETVPVSSLPPGQHIISTKWVLTKQVHYDTTAPRYKARLTIRGFQDLEKHHVQSFAPTISRSSLRLLLCVLAQNQWTPWALDFKTAFLQGAELSREVYVQPPVDFVSPDLVWRAKKAIYGLPSAPAAWYHQLHTTLTRCGFQRSQLDPCVYLLLKNHSLHGVFGVHVDDGIYGGTPTFHAAIGQVRKLLRTKAPRAPPYDFCGLQVGLLTTKEGRIGISLSQESYASTIQPIHPVEDVTPLTYRAVVGKLLYLVGHTRPDLAFHVSLAAAFNKEPTVEAAKEVNKVVDLVARRPSRLEFWPVKEPQLVTFSDASWGNLPDKGSQGGFITAIVDKCMRKMLGVVDFRSHKLRRACASSMTAETLAMTEALDSAAYYGALLAECGFGRAPVRLLTDCGDLFQSSKNKNITEEKRLMINISAIRNDVEGGEAEVWWIPNAYNIADVLTKRKAPTFHYDLAIDNNRILFEQYANQVKKANQETLTYFYQLPRERQAEEVEEEKN